MSRRLRNTYVICGCAAMFFWGLCFSFLPPLVSRIIERIGISLSEYSVMLSVRSAANMLACFFLLGLLDRFSVNKVMGPAVFVLAPCVLIYIRTRSPLILLALVPLMGVCAAMIESGCDMMPYRLPKDGGNVSYIMYTFLSVGQTLGPVIVRGLLRREADVFLPIAGAVAPALVFGVVLFLLPPLWGEDESRGEASAEVTKGKFHSRLVLQAAGLVFFTLGIASALQNWVATAVFRGGIASEADAALLNSAFCVGAMLSLTVLSYLNKRLPPYGILLFALGLMTLATVGFLFAGDARACLALMFLYGVGDGPFYSAFLSTLNTKETISGRSLGFIFGMNSLGMVVFIWLAGRLLDTAGPRAFFGLISLVTAAGLPFLIPILRKNPKSA